MITGTTAQVSTSWLRSRGFVALLANRLLLALPGAWTGLQDADIILSGICRTER